MKRFIITLIIPLSFAVSANAQYTYTEFSVPNSYYTEARAINNNDVAVGC